MPHPRCSRELRSRVVDEEGEHDDERRDGLARWRVATRSARRPRNALWQPQVFSRAGRSPARHRTVCGTGTRYDPCSAGGGRARRSAGGLGGLSANDALLNTRQQFPGLGERQADLLQLVFCGFVTAWPRHMIRLVRRRTHLEMVLGALAKGTGASRQRPAIRANDERVGRTAAPRTAGAPELGVG